MTHINAIFDNMDVWRNLPAYQLERRSDIFFSIYLPEILSHKFGIKIEGVIPEFPIRVGTIHHQIDINKSFKVDYLAKSNDGKTIILVELKTDEGSRRDKQDWYLERAKEVGLVELLDGVRKIYKATNSKKKYEYLLGLLQDYGQNGQPSNHLCDSQVCCVNFLFAFSDKPDALASVLRPVFPDIRTMLPVENGQYVAFEWIGEENYLGEKISRNGKRTRGANFTSADAIVMFERIDGRRQIVLIEWKYTESYGGTSLKIAKSGTDRTSIYRPLFRRGDCPINKELLPNFEALFYEPFYQLMRQQFLAHEMERAQELGADIVCVLHIAPDHNTDFRSVTSPELKPLSETVTDTWKKLAQPSDRFISASTERLFGGLSVEQLPEMRVWLEYIKARYPWIQADTASRS